MDERPDWDPVRALSQRVLAGAALQLTDDVRALLLRTAREVGISDASEALSTEPGALALLHECMRRIKDGSWRFVRALRRMRQHQEAGDYDSARQEMRDVLTVEVVPYYRMLAQEQLDDMADAP